MMRLVSGAGAGHSTVTSKLQRPPGAASESEKCVTCDSMISKQTN